MIYHQLHDRGFDVYYPYLIIKTQNPNMLKIEPYFPGYVFVNINLDEVAPSTFQWMPLTEGLVCIAEHPVYVPDHIIWAIHRNVWKVNSLVLGVPEAVTGYQQNSVEVDLSSGNGDLFSKDISAEDRSRSLFQYFHITSQELD